MRLIQFFADHFKLFTLALFTLGLYSCYPGSIDNIEETDIVGTQYDRDYFDRKSPASYVMPDTVGRIGDGDPQLDRDEMDFILAQVERNLDELGYTRLSMKDLEEGRLPDVVVTTSAMVIKVTGTGCIPYWPGWCWWPGWGYYPPGWSGWCYPTYLYSYTTGTLAIDMISPEESDPDEEEFKRVWSGGLNGILRSSVQGNENFVRDGIDKAFELSPYLRP